MSAIQTTVPNARTAPARLNGDHDLSSDDRAAYLNFHAARNRDNAARSAREGVSTRPATVRTGWDLSLASPSRLVMDAFLARVARRYARYRGGEPLRVLDIGCGSGYASASLAAAGLGGEYIGIDHQPHPGFDAVDGASFARRRIITDILDLDPEAVGPVDLLLSMTALEHFPDDAGALAIARRTLAPGGAEIHFVPAEDGLRLWRTHGWRQYSPACVRDLCPGAELYRIGGAASGLLHEHAITRPNDRGIDWRSRRPRAYRVLRAAAMALDPWFGCRPAAIYAAVSIPRPQRETA